MENINWSFYPLKAISRSTNAKAFGVKVIARMEKDVNLPIKN
jgi:hypothetical protein